MKLDRRSDIDSAELEGIVRKEIDWKFYETWLTDQRIPKMYERHPEKELKQEAYAIFFKSLDDILETIGARDRKIIIHLSWWAYRQRKIEAYKIVHDDISEPLMNKNEDFVHDLEWYFLLFKFKGIKYRLGLSSRIGLIVDFLVTKGIFEPFMEAAQAYRHPPEVITDSDGQKWYPIDMTNYIRYWGTGIGRDLESMKKRIWSPKIELLYHDEPEGERRIGDPYNK